MSIYPITFTIYLQTKNGSAEISDGEVRIGEITLPGTTFIDCVTLIL